MNQYNANLPANNEAHIKHELKKLLPEERCNLDGRVPVDPVRLACGHVYCKTCIQDMSVSAALIGGVAKCKKCFQKFNSPSLQAVPGRVRTLDVVRARYGVTTGTTSDYPQIAPNTLGAVTSRMLGTSGAPALPWVPPSQQVGSLLDQYTAAEPVSFEAQVKQYLDQEKLLAHRFSRPSLNRALRSQQTGSTWPASNDMPDFHTDDFELFDFSDLTDIGDETGPLFETPMTPTSGFGSSTREAQSLVSPPSSIPYDHSSPSQMPLDRCTSMFLGSPSLSPTDRDMSVFAGTRFVFKGIHCDEAAMKAAVTAYGGVVTGGGYKHTDYGVVGKGWKPTPVWTKNKIVVLNEEEFWQLLEQKKQESYFARLKA